MKIGLLDCFAGAAGDMWVGALLDAGLPLQALQDLLASLRLPGVAISATKVKRAGLAGTHFVVRIEHRHHEHGDHGEHHHEHRHLDDLLAIVARAAVPAEVRARAERVFRLLASVEAKAHDVPAEAVHFHELGAEDTIVDVLGTCAGVHWLGLEQIYASAVTVGSGIVRCAHGDLPVPAPGALGALFGVPIRQGPLAGERCTPTGAALLKVLVDEFEPTTLTWVPEAVGYGAGTRDDPEHPNLLRLTIGERRQPGSAATLWEGACNLDTATGEELGYLIEGLLARGAVDAFAVPLTMKKGRPGWQLGVLVDDARREVVARFLLEESTSLGVRWHQVERALLERWHEDLDTEFGRIRVKVARLPSGALARRPEADEVDRVVRERQLPRAEVLARIHRGLVQ